MHQPILLQYFSLGNLNIQRAYELPAEKLEKNSTGLIRVMLSIDNLMLPKYLCFVWSYIVNITVCSNVVPDSIQGVKVTYEFQSSLCICIGTSDEKGQIVKLQNRKLYGVNCRCWDERNLCTALINWARITDSIWDSARVRR